MKKILLAGSLIFLIPCISAQTFKHGLLLGGGTGSISHIRYVMYDADEDFQLVRGSGAYKYNAVIGYKLRYAPLADRLFYDTDLQAGLRKAGSSNYYKAPEGMGLYLDRSYVFCNVALGLTANYKISKGLYAGVGVEPTYGFYELGEHTDQRFDMPVLVKLGYDLKYVDLAVVYKKGLFNVIKSKEIEKGKLNDLQIQLFIPF